MRRIEIPLLLVLIIALLAGCGGGATPAATAPTATTAAGQPAAPPATEAAGASQPAATEVVQPAATALVQAALTPAEAEEESLDLQDREDALKGLKSYRATWSYTWTGQKDGKDQTVEWVATQEYSAEPGASHMKMEMSDSLEPDQAGGFEMIQVGQKSYMLTTQNGEQNCVAFSSEDNQLTDSLGPSSFGSIRGGRYVGQETVNGIRTKHYRYDEKATGLTGFTKLSGNVWVAVDGGYAVKDVAEWEGSFIGATDEGKGSWTWELSEVNQPLEITAPAGCESGAEGMPVMADATEQATMGDLVTYKSKSTLADAIQFYQDEMPKAGWIAEGDATVTDQFANLAFSKGEKKANVMLSSDGDGVTVMISVEK